MKTSLLYILILLAGAASLTAADSAPKIGPQSPLSNRITELVINENYDAALLLLDSLIQKEPLHPYGWLIRATVLATRSIDYEDNVDMPALLTACEKTKALSQPATARTLPKAEADLYCGMAEMLLVMIDHREGRLIAAVKRLVVAGKHLKQAVALDAQLWDAYYGLGMYQYYVSRNAGIIRSLGLVSDRRDVGLMNIRIAAEKGSITRNAARNGLAWINLGNEKYEETIRDAQALLTQYPERRAFLWLLGKAYLKSERWSEATSTLEKLKKAIQRQKRNNHLNEISCYKMLAEAYFGLGNWSKVIDNADQASRCQLTDWIKGKKKGDLQVLSDLRKKAQKKLNSLR